MGLTSQPIPWYMKSLPGMNNKVEVEELEEKWVEIAQNCRFETSPGAVVKREPISYFNVTAIDGNPVMSLYRYYTSSGITKFIATSGVGIYVGDDANGTFTLIRTVTTTGKRFKFVTYKDILIGSSGYDNIFCYDGATDNTTWELGSCKAKIGAAGAITRTAISYKITWDDDWYVPGAVSNTIATVTAQNILLSNVPLGPIGTVNRKIYRKSSETGGAYRLITTLANNTATTYTDSTADASAGTIMPGVTDSIPRGAELQQYRERLFITRDPSNPSRIYYSDPYTPWYIQKDTQLMYLDISPEDNDEIMGIPIVMGNIVCIKKNTIRKIFVLGPTGNWYAEDPFSFSGSPAAYSITQTPYGIMYLGWDHWYLYDGANPLPVIDEFDTAEILPANYYGVVGFWDNTEFLAAYTDISYGSQVPDRVMRYNYKRKTLCYDTIKANCFASKRGDQETGELYYGASNNGYVYKSVNEDIVYKLATKTDALAGTGTQVFIGGTESNPYIEIGSITTALAIPTNMCIFWDSEDTSPGAGWTEITAWADNFIKISATAGTVVAASTHTHPITGQLNATGTGRSQSGQYQNDASTQHTTHSVNITSAASSVVPRYVSFRLFYKNATTTESEFPEGSIVMWDQTAIPEGYTEVGNQGYYVRIGATLLNEAFDSSHLHSFSDYSGYAGQSGRSNAGGNCPAQQHRHLVAGSTQTKEQNDWELDYVALHFIKRIGETGTWDGTEKYAYALYWTVGAPGNGWSEVSATYEGRFLKMGEGAVVTGAAANAAHTHEITAGTSGQDTPNAGNSESTSDCEAHHTHPWTLTTTSANSSTPANVTMRLFRKILGKMKDYNGSWETAGLTTGSWVSPSAQLSPDTLKTLWWNESLVGTDNILVYIRTGATQAICQAAAWMPVGGFTNPNAQSLATITVAIWIQVKVEFSCTDTTVSNPKLYSADGYLLKFSYSKGAVQAETSVEFIYDIGFRHFEQPAMDKIHQLLISRHEGEFGSFSLYWETENASGTFTISLSSNPKRWQSFFPSDAMGKEVKFRVYKNDLYAFRLKELQGYYSPQPLLI